MWGGSSKNGSDYAQEVVDLSTDAAEPKGKAPPTRRRSSLLGAIGLGGPTFDASPKKADAPPSARPEADKAAQDEARKQERRRMSLEINKHLEKAKELGKLEKKPLPGGPGGGHVIARNDQTFKESLALNQYVSAHLKQKSNEEMNEDRWKSEHSYS